MEAKLIGSDAKSVHFMCNAVKKEMKIKINEIKKTNAIKKHKLNFCLHSFLVALKISCGALQTQL